ncbi:hypothetical protein CI610_00893 [invertebrate metagenome]|uniref:Lipopeptide n=1 Tax=invertebrate metagenome TaxID=1711999 RepID=A0A2H9TAA3_9ZZZZ
MVVLKIVIALVFSTLLLTGCGQKGSLYLPDSSHSSYQP